jgi:hypothetical protein
MEEQPEHASPLTELRGGALSKSKGPMLRGLVRCEHQVRFGKAIALGTALTFLAACGATTSTGGAGASSGASPGASVLPTASAPAGGTFSTRAPVTAPTLDAGASGFCASTGYSPPYSYSCSGNVGEGNSSWFCGGTSASAPYSYSCSGNIGVSRASWFCGGTGYAPPYSYGCSGDVDAGRASWFCGGTGDAPCCLRCIRWSRTEAHTDLHPAYPARVSWRSSLPPPVIG